MIVSSSPTWRQYRQGEVLSSSVFVLSLVLLLLCMSEDEWKMYRRMKVSMPGSSLSITFVLSRHFYVEPNKV